MAIKNINTIQNTSDLDYIKEQSNEYILQSLANLGQRIGVPGDGVKINEFNFASLVNGEQYDPAKFIGCIRYSNNGDSNPYSLSIYNKETNQYVDGINIPITSPFDYIVTSDICKLQKIINGVDAYDTYGVIKASDMFYTLSFKGVVDENVRFTTKEYICETINKFNNDVVSALRIRDLYGKLILGFIDKKSSDIYYKFQKYDIVGDLSIDDIYKYINDNIPQDIIDPHIVVENLLSNNIITITEDSFDVNYNKETNNFEFTNQIDKQKYDKLSIFLTYFSYDLIYLYRYVKNYYSEITYNSNNIQFKRQILLELFRCMLSYDGYSSKRNNEYVIYIPLDYVFNYACSTDNEWKIYYNTLDVSIKYVSQTQIERAIDDLDNSSFVTTTTNSERVAMFNYSVDYDPEDTNIIYDVYAYKHYTLPYINSEYYWVINDVDSNIYARGINAGNPNIILIKTNVNSSNDDIVVEPEIVAAANMSLIGTLKWKYEIVQVDRIKNINLNTETTGYSKIKIKCAVPDLEYSDVDKRDEYLVALDNALILNMSDANCVIYDSQTLAEYQYTEEQIKEEFGENGVITTIWHLKPNSYDFECAKLEDSDVVIDFNYITNFNNLINYALNHHEPKHPDKYAQKWIVFEQANFQPKNNKNYDIQRIYPVLRNIKGLEFNQNYLNDFNFTLQYNDGIDYNKVKRNEIDNISQSNSRYYSYNNTNVTNANYKVNNKDDDAEFYNEYIYNYNVPSLDLGEVFTRNETLLNRLNIISIDEQGKQYLSYIGNSHALDKSKFVIGSSTTNINMGVSSLSNYGDRSHFNVQNEIYVNFKETYILNNEEVGNDLTIKHNTITYGFNWHRYKTENNNTTYFVTDYIPEGRYIYEPNCVLIDSEYEFTGFINLQSVNDNSNVKSYMGELINYNTVVDICDKDKLFAGLLITEKYANKSGDNGQHNIYLSDAIYIPSLIYKIGLGKYISTDGDTMEYIDTDNVNIVTNMPIYSYTTKINNYSKTVPMLLGTTSTLLTDNGYYNYIETTKYKEDIKDYTYGLFRGNALNISYYENNNKLYISIYEHQSDNLLQYPEKLKYIYNK